MNSELSHLFGHSCGHILNHSSSDGFSHSRSDGLRHSRSVRFRHSRTPRHSREGGNPQFNKYEDIAGYCKSATLEDIKTNDYVLTPGRYVGAAEIEDDGIPFETKMTELSKTLYSQMEQAEELDKAIRKNLEVLGYGK